MKWPGEDLNRFRSNILAEHKKQQKMANSTTVESSVFGLLNNVRKRPEMYLGKPSIYHLQCFLGGWSQRSPNGIEDAALFDEFASWIAKKYKVKSTQGWAKIIEFWSADEVDALKQFFVLLDEFQSSSKKQSK